MKRIIIILPILIMLITCYSFAQWERMNSAPCGVSYAMYETEERIFVNSNFDLYYAENNGEYKWKLFTLPKELIIYKIEDIIEVENTVYVATDRGLYYTSNEGEDWKHEAFEGLYNENTPHLYDLEYINNTFFAVSSSDIIISKNNGETWSVLDNIDFVQSSITANESIVVATFKGSQYSNSCIWLSYDYGENWIDVTNNLSYKYIIDEMIIDTTIYIATKMGIFKSSIYNVNWESLNNTGYGFCYLLSYDGTLIYGLTSMGYFIYSEDNGLTWEKPISEGISPEQYICNDMYYNNGNIILLTTSGLIKTSDLGLNWTEANDGFCSMSTSNFIIRDSEMFISQRQSGVFSSTDWGETWSNMNQSVSSIYDRDIWSICKTDDALYSGAYYSSTLRVTTNNGATWSNFSDKLTNGWYLFIKEYKDYLFIGFREESSDNFLFRAKKDGTTIDTIKYNNSNITTAIDVTYDNDKLYMSTYTDGVLLSEDDGITWQCISDDLAETYFYSLAFSDGTLFAGAMNGNIYSTSDIGQNWNLLYEAQNDSSYVSSIKVKDDNLFFINSLNVQYYSIEYLNSVHGCEANGLNVIKTNGENYADISFNVVSRIFGDIGFKEDTLIVSSRGLYKMPISEIERLSVDVDIRGDYLYACPPYPLPADQEVNVKIYWDAVLGLEYADMAVYDLDGNRICGKEAIEINRTGSWNAIVTWNSSGVVPGVYFLIVKHGMKSRCVKFLIE